MHRHIQDSRSDGTSYNSQVVFKKIVGTSDVTEFIIEKHALMLIGTTSNF